MNLIFKTFLSPSAGKGSGSIFSVVCLFVLLAGLVARAQPLHDTYHFPPASKRVLLIFNEGKDVPGNVVLEGSVRSAMLKATTNRLVFLPEYLDASRYPDAQHFQVFQQYLGKKYADSKPDLIVVFPSRDYRLAADLPDALFPEVPVVFVAVNEMEVPETIRKLGVTGIVQRFDLRGTLGLMSRLQPDTRKVVVVSGVSSVDQANLRQILETSRSVEGIQFDIWTNRPVATLTDAVKSLPKGTVILLSTVLRDVTGEAYFMAPLAQMLSSAANVPIYTLGGWVIGHGALGGSVVNPVALGERAGQLAIRLLNGTDPGSVPIEVNTEGTPMFDWRELRRWHIPESRLLPGSVVLFRPETLWDQHRDLILILLVVFVAQTLTISGLLFQRQRRYRAEAEILHQRTELSHVSRVATVGQLTSALTHELNQPLGAILRNTEAAEFLLRKNLPDLREIHNILADIRLDDERAGKVIERLRSLLKRRVIELKPLDLAVLLPETIALAQPDAQRRQIILSLEVAPALPAVHGDRVHLQQVLLNLILNGMDALAKVWQEERLLIIRAGVSENGAVEVSVSDTGHGFPSDQRERLFEAFFTTKPEGMGMGLAISKTIVEAHGGKIWARDNQPCGAIFTFSLPAHASTT